MSKAYEFLNGKDIAVHCKTEEEAKEFFEMIKDDGIKWLSGGELAEYHCWETYKEHTCYRIDEDKKMLYGNYERCKKYDNQIIEFAELKKKVEQEKLKVGDRVKVVELLDFEHGTNLRIGDTGTVTMARELDCHVRFDKGRNIGLIQYGRTDGTYLMGNFQVEKIKEENKMEFSKKDLKSGMVVELRDGSRFLTVEINGRLDLIGKDTWDSLSLYNENLTDADRDFDIVKVYETYPRPFGRMLKGGILIWERKEPKEMTIADIEKELGYPV